MKKIEIYDTTLREGEQSASISFTADDKINILHALDALGVSYIEAGMVTGEADKPFLSVCERLMQTPLNSQIAFLCATRRAGETCEKSLALKLLANSKIKICAVVGKASMFHVKNVLAVTPEENLDMISDTVSYLKAHGKSVFFDCEHFFDGAADDPAYALSVVRRAAEAGADRIILCDTNGAALPDDVAKQVAAACEISPVGVGVHCHNDLGLAVAATLSACCAGAIQAQCTVSGIGERTGCANLNTIIPLLQLKLGFECIEPSKLKKLTKTARLINELCNRSFDEHEPFVGGYAFCHKAGLHIDAVMKTSRASEHIEPECVGNVRNIAISPLAGRAAIAEKLGEALPNITKQSPYVTALAERLSALEKAGYTYDNAAASLKLVIDEVLQRRRSFFSLLSMKVVVDDRAPCDSSADSLSLQSSAVIKIAVGEREEITAAEGVGPVNAIDAALRRALSSFYPQIDRVRLADYKVRVISTGATAATVRVLIESTDGVSVWRTVGVSPDIINASWQALRDSVEYYLSSNS